MRIAIWVTLGMVVGALVMSLLMPKTQTPSHEISKESPPATSVAMPTASDQTTAQTSASATATAPSTPADIAAQTLVEAAAKQANSATTQAPVAMESQSIDPSMQSTMIQTDDAGSLAPVQISENGSVLNTTVSGYPIDTSGKAVDAGSDNPNWTVTRSGLVGNPCVDPPSVKGRAFTTSN